MEQQIKNNVPIPENTGYLAIFNAMEKEQSVEYPLNYRPSISAIISSRIHAKSKKRFMIKKTDSKTITIWRIK